jgi:hypothetical protein
MRWLYHVDIKDLMTEEEDYESIKKSMKAIAEVLEKEPCFKNFTYLPKFRKIPKGNDVLGPIDYANRLIDRMYDYADDNKIWIG